MLIHTSHLVLNDQRMNSTSTTTEVQVVSHPLGSPITLLLVILAVGLCGLLFCYAADFGKLFCDRLLGYILLKDLKIELNTTYWLINLWASISLQSNTHVISIPNSLLTWHLSFSPKLQLVIDTLLSWRDIGSSGGDSLGVTGFSPRMPHCRIAGLATTPLWHWQSTLPQNSTTNIRKTSKN